MPGRCLVDLILGNAQVSTTLTISVPVSCLTPDDAEPTGDGPPHAAGTDLVADKGADGSAVEPDPAGRADPAGSETGAAADGLQAAVQRRWATGAPGCAIPGIGIIPAAALQTLLGRFGVRVSRMLVDARTGVTIETGSAAYRPPARLQQFVRARDGTCRFPGCRVAARRCQLDHVKPWPHGPTAPGNLICLCTHHHRLKTHTRWRPRLHPDGTVTWTDPFGQTYQSNPADHLRAHVA